MLKTDSAIKTEVNFADCILGLGGEVKGLIIHKEARFHWCSACYRLGEVESFAFAGTHCWILAPSETEFDCTRKEGTL